MIISDTDERWSSYNTNNKTLTGFQSRADAIEALGVAQPTMDYDFGRFVLVETGQCQSGRIVEHQLKIHVGALSANATVPV